MALATARKPLISEAKRRLNVDRERETIQQSYPDAQLVTQINGQVESTHEFTISYFPKYAAQKQSIECVKVLLYCAIVRILRERSNLPPDAFQNVTMDPKTGLATYNDFVEASRGVPPDGLQDGQGMTVFKVGKYKRITDLIALLENGIFPEIEKGGVASLQLLMCLVDERPTNVMELWTFSFSYGDLDEKGLRGLTYPGRDATPTEPNFVLGMVSGNGEKEEYSMPSHVQVDSLVRRAGGLSNHVGYLANVYAHSLKHALKYYFYLHYNDRREKGAAPLGFDGPPLPTLNFVSTFEYGRRCRYGDAVHVDSYVKVGLGVEMLDASKASLTDSENAALGRPVYLTEVTQEDEMKFAAYQTWRRRHWWHDPSDYDEEAEQGDEPGPSNSSKRQRTTKASGKQGRVKTSGPTSQTKQDRLTRTQLRTQDMSSQTKQDRLTQTQLRTMNVPSTQATNAGPTQSETDEHDRQHTPLAHPKIKRIVLSRLRIEAGDRNIDALGVLGDGKPQTWDPNGDLDFTILEEIECLCDVKSIGPAELIQCDYCQMWQHIDCVGFLGAHDVRIPDQYLCTSCWKQLKYLKSPQITELEALLIQKQVLGYLLRNDYPLGDGTEVARVIDLNIVGPCTPMEMKELSVYFWRKKILRELIRNVPGFDRNTMPSYALCGIDNDYGAAPKESKAFLEKRRADAVAEVMNPLLHVSHLYTYGADEEQSHDRDTMSATGNDKDPSPDGASAGDGSPSYPPQASIEDLLEDGDLSDGEYSSNDGDSIPPKPVSPIRARSTLLNHANAEADAPAALHRVSRSRKLTSGRDNDTISLASSRAPGALSRPLFLDDTTNTASSNIDSSDFEL